MFKLIIEDDEGHTTVVPLVREEITIGRKEGNTIRLTERNVSRHHARLLRSNGSVFVEDLDSYNGVKVNGDRITVRTSVREGDLVEIGDYHFALQWTAEEESVRGAHAGRTEPPPPLPLAAKPFGPSSSDDTTVVRVPMEQKRGDGQKSNTIPADQAGRLVITTTELAGTSINLNRTEMTLGRADDCEIPLAHRSVSNKHAKMIYDGGIYRIVDLDSANGILVNGEEYARVDIRKGDIIELGHVRMRYVAPGEDFLFVPEEPTEQRRNPTADLQDDQFAIERKPRSVVTWVLAAVGVMVAVVIAFGVYQWFKKPSTGTNGQVVQKDGGIAAEDPATADYMNGLDQFKARDFTKAKAAFVAALGKNPNHIASKTMLERTQKEQSYTDNMTKAHKAITEKDWDTALDELNQVPNDSLAFAEVEKLKPEVTRQYLAFHLDSSNRMKDQDKLEEALRHVGAVLIIDDHNATAINLKKTIEAKLAARKPQHPNVPDRKIPDKPVKEPTEPKVDRAKEAAELWQAGRQAYMEKRYNDVIQIVPKVLKLNPNECLAYIALGGSYATMGDPKRALVIYEKYLQVCPTHQNAAQIRLFIKDYKEKQSANP